MFCKHCGTELPDNTAFCSNCGGSTAPVQQPAEPQPVESQPVESQPVVNQPVVNQPAANQPAANQPVYTQPAANQPVYTQPVANQPVYTQPVYAQPVVTHTVVTQPMTIPEQNRPLSPWAYWGLQILFSIPVIGFIFLIVFSISDSNINRRNFARSYWCTLVLSLIIIVILAATGGLAALTYNLF